MREAVLAGDVEQIGLNLSAYWEQKKLMAPGAEPPLVKSLIDAVKVCAFVCMYVCLCMCVYVGSWDRTGTGQICDCRGEGVCFALCVCVCLVCVCACVCVGAPGAEPPQVKSWIDAVKVCAFLVCMYVCMFVHAGSWGGTTAGQILD